MPIWSASKPLVEKVEDYQHVWKSGKDNEKEFDGFSPMNVDEERCD